MAEREEGGKLGWFVAGAVLGGAVALLYAPKSGKETRGKQIADDAADLFERGRRLVRG
jgi:gas vesicle protein